MCRSTPVQSVSWRGRDTRSGRASGPSVTPLLDVAGLRTEISTRSATVQAVRDVSFSIAPGETLGLVGESGCGKSMTGMSLMRLLPSGGRIAAGSVKLAGKELTTLSEGDIRRVRGNDVAMIFQDPMTSLNPTMTVGDQIAEPAIIHQGLSQKDALQPGPSSVHPIW